MAGECQRAPDSWCCQVDGRIEDPSVIRNVGSLRRLAARPPVGQVREATRDQIRPLRLSPSSGSSVSAAPDTGAKPRSAANRPPLRSDRRPARRGLARACVGAASTSGSRSRLAVNATAIQIRLLLMGVASVPGEQGARRVPQAQVSMGNTCRCSERENQAIRDGKTPPRAQPFRR